jgi:ferredoxin-type protein NapG
MAGERRQFLARTLQGAAVAACGGSVWYGLIAQQAEAAPHALRPPGATPPRDFAATCAKCGRCVAACPYGTLRLADLAGHGASGLPYFEPRTEPCAMCPDLPCVKACPTGALDRGLTDIAKARMGLAVIDAENCLSWQGLRCEVCYRVCPVKGTAIRIDPHPRQISKHAVFVPVVSSEACTGCGLCEKACPTEVASIRVVQPALVQGRIGTHYRLGWKHDESVPAGAVAAPGTDAPWPPPTSSSPAPAKAPGVDYLNR